MNALLNKVMILGFSFTAMSALAQQNSGELTCRSKAKDIAAQAYTSCIGDARTAQIDQVRKDYQKQLAELKIRYDKELKKLGGSIEVAKESSKEASKAPSKEITSTDITASTRGAMKAKPAKTASIAARPKATKGIVRALPTRKEVKTTPAPAMREREEQTTVVTPDTAPDLALPSSDDDAAQKEMQMTLNPAAE